MNHAIAFDTYAYVRKLRDAGVDEAQAAIQAEALVALVEDRLATKQDINNLKRDMKEIETNLKRDMKEMDLKAEARLKELDTKLEITKTELQKDMENHKLSLQKDIEISKIETIKWTAGMFIAQTAMIVGAMFAVMKMNQSARSPTPPPAHEMRLPATPNEPAINKIPATNPRYTP